MTTLLFAALWVNLAQCVLLTGAFFVLLLAGRPATDFMRQWERRVLFSARWFVVVALASGVIVLAIQTGVFEDRPEAALEPRAIWHAMLDTRTGFIWMVRHGLLTVLAAFLFLEQDDFTCAHSSCSGFYCLRARFRLSDDSASSHRALGADVTARQNWIGARGEAFLLAALGLVVVGSSGHLAASPESLWPRAIDMVHLLGAGVWVGGLPPLALLLYGASRGAATPDPYAVRTMQRFSRVALITVLILASSGIASAWLLVGGVAGVVGTTHGHFLFAKIVVLAAALLLAAASRAMLPTLSSATAARSSATARRMALFIAVEAALVLVVLGAATAMTMTTPALHDNPVWPWSFRISVDAWPQASALQRLAHLPIEFALAGSGLTILAIIFLVRRRPLALFGTLFALIAGGAAFGLQPLIVQAYPTSFLRSPLPYTAGSIAEGISVYQAHCASCHGTPTPDRTGGVGKLR